IQALEEWQNAKEADARLPQQERTVPNHRVVIPVISGASAGGITAALGTVAVGAGPIATHSSYVLPALYEAWVRKVSFTRMLEGRDLKRRLESLLDSTVIEDASGTLLLDSVQNFKSCRPCTRQRE